MRFAELNHLFKEGEDVPIGLELTPVQPADLIILIVSDLTYDLRSGSPDFVDRLVAFTFAGMAMDAVQEGRSGLMTAINEGRYATVPIPDPKLGPRRVDI